ncbi:MAG: coenzyme F420-0:L-glutamate ligase [Rhodobacteraceae bacterium]|nr:coenzyme F420-0:L-glutamate ligase [Paracoccaceae bacterium]
MTAALRLEPVPGLSMIQAGDDLAALTAKAVQRAGLKLEGGDVVCVAQKVVSKAEGRQVDLDDVQPSAQAVSLGAETDKDPRLVQLILDESTEVLRQRPGILIVRHRLGLVCANAGIDQSNIDHGGGDQALLLPLDPDRSAPVSHRAKWPDLH